MKHTTISNKTKQLKRAEKGIGYFGEGILMEG